ncbi:hypothetical protein QFC21_001565 [Naganishia friedmannii]|uniref:Uncharacterized protein n=1 Tax=Naganishia friedmannii TaxID=89922 RepID=A0ACC2W3U9_9TREE|nr:hypothetical protein QFC21_001565 [Naganishia friedmannii]
MFSSPLPYKRSNTPPTSASSRYAEALPPPVPASPLRNPPPPAPIHAYTYYAPSSHPAVTAPPPLNHAYTAPAGWTNIQPARASQQPEWQAQRAAESAWNVSRPVLIDQQYHSQPYADPRRYQEQQHQQVTEEGESEASKLVRLMSRHRRPLQATDAAPPSSPLPSEWLPTPAQGGSMQQQHMFSPSTGVFPLTISSPAGAGYFQPTFYEQQQPPPSHPDQYNTYGDNTDLNAFASTSTYDQPMGPPNSSSINNPARWYPYSPFPETDSQVASGTATPLPPYVAYAQSQSQPPQQQTSQSQLERNASQQHAHGFHLAGDVKPAPCSVSDGQSSTTAAMTANAQIRRDVYHPPPHSNTHTTSHNIDTTEFSESKTHHQHSKSIFGPGTGGIVLGGMTMPNAQEYASIPSYGASVTSDDSSYYYTSEEDSSDSDSEAEADQRRRAEERGAKGGAGNQAEMCENERRERQDSFPSIHSRPEDDAHHPQTSAQAQPPAVSQLERAGSIAAGSIHSFRAGDEVGFTAPPTAVNDDEHEHGQGLGNGKEPAAQGKADDGDYAVKASTGGGGKRSLIYSYHPPPADLPATSNNEEHSEIPLFCAPTSFQLLGQSLKRLLADLMVSASTSFVPAPSAYASSSAETPVWRVEVWVRTLTLPVPPVAGALVVGKRGGAKQGQGKRWMVGGGYRTMVGIELDEEVVRPALSTIASRSSGAGGVALALTRTRSSRHTHADVADNEHQQQTAVSTLPARPAATTSDSTNTLLPAFDASHVLRLRLPLPLHAPFTASQLVETLHKHYQYGKRVGRSTTTSLAAGTVEENAYAFARMMDRAPGPVDEAARLSKAHKLGRTAFWDGRTVPPPDERGAGEDIQGQVGRKGFRYTMRKAVSKAVGAVQGEREDTVEDDRANWVTPFTG